MYSVMRTISSLCTGLILLAPVLQAQPELVVQAKRLITGTGVVHEPGMMLVREGKVVAIGATVEASGTVHTLRHEGTVMPGMIDLSISPGGPAATNENIVAATPGLRALDGIDLHDRQFETWARHGFTTVHVAPFPGTTVSGTSAVTKTGGSFDARVLKSTAGLRVSLNGRARPEGRAPTSLMGALVMLREQFTSSNEPTLKTVRAGELPVWFDVDGFVEVRAALHLASTYGFSTVIVGPTHPGEVLARVAAAGLPLVLGPLSYDATERQLRSYGALHHCEVPVGFASGVANENAVPGLRRTAALAVREGMDPELALRALTLDAARILGVDARVGSLEVGKDADFVWLSGDPLDLGTRIEAVFIGGTRVDRNGGE